jgi:hypothetical protein
MLWISCQRSAICACNKVDLLSLFESSSEIEEGGSPFLYDVMHLLPGLDVPRTRHLVFPFQQHSQYSIMPLKPRYHRKWERRGPALCLMNNYKGGERKKQSISTWLSRKERVPGIDVELFRKRIGAIWLELWFGIVASDIFNQKRPSSREESSFTFGLKDKEASHSRGYLSTYRDVAALGGFLTVGAFHSVVE